MDTGSHGSPVIIGWGYGIDCVSAVGSSGSCLDDFCSFDSPVSVEEVGTKPITYLAESCVVYLNMVASIPKSKVGWISASKVVLAGGGCTCAMETDGAFVDPGGDSNISTTYNEDIFGRTVEAMTLSV